jgi:hypothetical protein
MALPAAIFEHQCIVHTGRFADFKLFKSLGAEMHSPGYVITRWHKSCGVWKWAGLLFFSPIFMLGTFIDLFQILGSRELESPPAYYSRTPSENEESDKAESAPTQANSVGRQSSVLPVVETFTD